ncbi:hypothetical protein J7E78_05265 [Paenibacillus polymyxa]|uniref:hypothetical protein n=1 Tax=Paenibacillus polymyxa TaxID=1406 RepID=UPI001BEC6326|nr:hypothetical protein [Paenibacillus polymyxa]MBT2282947.1 hypothetical protein [Paenibacillus polymyxa]
MKTYVKVKHEIDGVHSYPLATGTHSYLKDTHRHKFYITVKAEVFHMDREIEFFELKDTVSSYFKNSFSKFNNSLIYDFGKQSCEMLAKGLMEHLMIVYNTHQNRRLIITVSEDNENESEVDNI